MILSGKISKENADKLGYQSPFSFRLVAGLNNKKEVVISLNTQTDNMNESYQFIVPDNMIDDLYYDIFGEKEMEEIK